MTISHSRTRWKKYYPKHLVFKFKGKYIIIGRVSKTLCKKNSYMIRVIEDGIPVYTMWTSKITGLISGIYRAFTYK